MSKVAIKSDLVTWARERSGVPGSALRKRFPKFQEWERGEAQPTLRQLEAFAKTTSTPLGYFFLPKPPDERLPIPDFRTVPGAQAQRPSPNLLETIQTMQQRQGWMRDFLIEEGEEPLAIVGSVGLQDDSDGVADPDSRNFVVSRRTGRAFNRHGLMRSKLYAKRSRPSASCYGQRNRWQQHSPQARRERISRICSGR